MFFIYVVVVRGCRKAQNPLMLSLMATTFDQRNEWERKLGLEEYSIHWINQVFEIVTPRFKQEGEFPAQTLRRILLAGEFAPKDFLRLRLFGKKGFDLLLLQLGLAATSDGRFIESV